MTSGDSLSLWLQNEPALFARIQRLAVRSQAKTVFWITALWAYIFSLIALLRLLVSNETAWCLLPALPLLLLLAGAQHAMLVLMHDAAHGRLFRNRRINDAVSNLFLSWPLLVSTESYRRAHMAHHKHLNTADDPDYRRKAGLKIWTFPKSRKAWAGCIALHVLGVGTWDLIKQLTNGQNARQSTERHPSEKNAAHYAKAAARGTYYVAVISLVLLLVDASVLALWFLAAFWMLPTLLYIRSVAEHFGLSMKDELSSSRNVHACWLTRLTLAPFNVNFHLDHHLFPGVPWHRLPELHALLGNVPAYRARSRMTTGYLSMSSGALPAELARNYPAIAEQGPLQTG